MVTLKVNLNYPVKLKEGEEKTPFQELSAQYLEYAVTQKYKDGLDGQFRRLWARIITKLDKAVDDNADSIELEEGEKDFIKRAFVDAKFPVALSKFVVLLEDEIENLGKKKK